MRLVDHLDAVMHAGRPAPVDRCWSSPPLPCAGFIELPEEPKRLTRRLDETVREDLLVLQALYDRPEGAEARTRALRRRLKIMPPVRAIIAATAVILFPVAILGMLVWSRFFPPKSINSEWLAWGLAVAAALYALFALKVVLWDRLRLVRLGRASAARSASSPAATPPYACSLGQLHRPRPRHRAPSDH